MLTRKSAEPSAPAAPERRKAEVAITALMGVAKHFHRIQTADGDVVTMVLDSSMGEEVAKEVPEVEDVAEVEVTKSIYCPITKAEEDKRLVTGVVLQPEVVDAQGDIYDEAVIEKAAHDFLAAYNAGNVIGLGHKEFNKPLDLCESYIAPGNIKVGGVKVAKGTWVMTVKVHDDAIWDKVRKGDIKGFSIGGMAKVKKLDQPEDKPEAAAE